MTFNFYITDEGKIQMLTIGKNNSLAHSLGPTHFLALGLGVYSKKDPNRNAYLSQAMAYYYRGSKRTISRSRQELLNDFETIHRYRHAYRIMFHKLRIWELWS